MLPPRSWFEHHAFIGATAEYMQLLCIVLMRCTQLQGA